MPKDELFKEPTFFSEFNTGLNLDQYLTLFEAATEEQQLIGEASTAYLTDPSSAKRIHAFNPAAKIIIILRNPADRAYSLYNWMVQEGYEYASSFRRALVLEEKRKNKKIPNYWEPEHYGNYMYFSSGLYYEQVKRYLDLFGNNVLVLKFDDLVSDLNSTYQEVCTFLGIQPQVVTPMAANPSKSVIIPALQFLLRKLNHRFVRLRGLHRKPGVGKEERDLLLRLGQLSGKPRKLDPGLRKMLVEMYRHDLEKLSELTGLDVSDWLDS